MKTRTANLTLLGLILATCAAGAFIYPRLPDRIASHWNAAGVANGTMSKGWGIFLVPLIMMGVFLLRLIILHTDPLKKNIESFKGYYESLWIALFIFFAYIFGLTMSWNLGYRFNFTVAIIPAMAMLFFVIGLVLEKSKRNWFLGIRTPWTLSSDAVWEKTHKLGGFLFKIAAAISLLGLFSRDATITIIALIVPIITAAVVTVVYSYVVYKKP